tara:strand:- start:97 stop:1284 length:1188 start_codon:yes stop_codon:yes gene_type:complete
MNFVNNYKYFFCFLACCLILFNFDLWKYYPLYSNELFGDWTYIYNYYSCLNNLEIQIVTCESILQFDFVYPKIWLKIVKIIYPFFKESIYLFIFFYLIISFNFFKDLPKIYHFLFLFSPISILLIQRGNNEILIFLLVFVFFQTLNYKKFKFFSVIPYIIASLLKIYPLSLVIIYFIENFKKISLLKIIVALVFLTIIYLFFNEFINIKNSYNVGKVTLVYSSKTIFFITNFIFKNLNFNYQLFSTIGLIIFIYLSFKIKIKNFKSIKSDKEIAFLIGSAILVSNFFLNYSFEYRFTYIIFTFPFIFDLKNIIKKKIIIYFIILIYSVLWFEFLIFYFKEIIQFNEIRSNQIDILNLKTSILGIIIIIKNIMYWIINFGLIVLSKNIIFNKLNKY